MAPRGTGAARSRAARLLRHPLPRLALPLVVLGVILLIDLEGGSAIRISTLMIAVPALCAAFLGPLSVLIVFLIALPLVVAAAADNNTLDTSNFPASFGTVVVLGIAAVLTAAIRQRRERELSQARWVAAVTQRALLPPLPDRIGSLRISTLYLASDAEAMIGGDIYATAALPATTRILVGDVRGKGLAAVEITGQLLAAFRRTARQRMALAQLPAGLDVSLREDLAESGGTSGDLAEGFVTAVVIDYTEGEDVVRVANCGHLPPLLLHDGTIRQLTPPRPWLPLGLGDLGGPGRADTYELAVGDTLLVYTDGVTEARDRAGVFYPFTDRLRQWAAEPPDALIDAVRADLLQHAGPRLTDDVAVVALHRAA